MPRSQSNAPRPNPMAVLLRCRSMGEERMRAERVPLPRSRDLNSESQSWVEWCTKTGWSFAGYDWLAADPSHSNGASEGAFR
jgi:hypothetical protein